MIVKQLAAIAIAKRERRRRAIRALNELKFSRNNRIGRDEQRRLLSHTQARGPEVSAAEAVHFQGA